LIWPKVPVEDNVCRNVMLGILVTLIAVIVAIKDAQTLLPINCHTALSKSLHKGKGIFI